MLPHCPLLPQQRAPPPYDADCVLRAHVYPRVQMFSAGCTGTNRSSHVCVRGYATRLQFSIFFRLAHSLAQLSFPLVLSHVASNLVPLSYTGYKLVAMTEVYVPKFLTCATLRTTPHDDRYDRPLAALLLLTQTSLVCLRKVCAAVVAERTHVDMACISAPAYPPRCSGQRTTTSSQNA